MKNTLFISLLCLLVSNAYAIPFNEMGDAGDLPGSAQSLTSGTDSILGSLLEPGGIDGNDIDMYGFIWGGGLFEAEVVSAAFGDSQLFIFDAGGSLIGLDDDGGVGTLSFFSDVLSAGSYFLAITRFNNDPLNAAGQQIDNCFFGSPACAGDLVVASWDGEDDIGGAYEILLNAPVSVMPVPEPGSLLLLTAGLLGFALRRRIR